ncbi:hypothetical protein JYT28_00440 [Desulfobulbus sp. AH-315-M07]|nr:hypothetical protein [Desulfobulbus sp. AH-315-M07]
MKTPIIAAALILAGCSQDAGQLETTDYLNDQTWEELIAGDWAVEPATEKYFCVRKTVDRDVDIAAFAADAPLATHHTVLTVGEWSQPDGFSECGVTSMNATMLFGSGVGTEPLHMPNGVAVRVEAGQQLLLNLHVFNTTADTLSGRSAIDIVRATDEVTSVAEVVLMGPMGLTIPPGEHQQSGNCTLSEDAFLFAVAPHMHRLGTHMQVIAHSSFSGDELLHDEHYDFEDQQARVLDRFVPMRAGDQVEVRCDFDNRTGDTVHWGESTRDEMCFAAVFRFPRANDPSVVCSL